MKLRFSNLFLLISFSSLLLLTQSLAMEGQNEDDISGLKRGLGALQEKMQVSLKQAFQDIAQAKGALEKEQKPEQKSEQKQAVSQQVEQIMKERVLDLLKKEEQDLVKQQEVFAQNQKAFGDVLKFLESAAQNLKSFRETQENTNKLRPLMQQYDQLRQNAGSIETQTRNRILALTSKERAPEKLAVERAPEKAVVVSKEGKSEKHTQQQTQQAERGLEGVYEQEVPRDDHLPPAAVSKREEVSEQSMLNKAKDY